MKKRMLLALTFAAIVLHSCKEPEEMQLDPEYHAHIMSPNSDTKAVGETIHLHVVFEDHNGGTVHHINVRVYNKADGTEIYNKPDVAHVHETSGTYEHHDDLTLNVDANTTWVVEAKVWGHEDGAHEVTESLEFDVQ
ncbi:MAG: hypothetical protein KDC44_21550 [Phaeodactylibacter sp.]|nr:hypothetical protein [Phaeodactylibacter sp.]